MAAWTAIIWFIAGCAGIQPTPPEGPSLPGLYDGQYDNNTILVNPREMSLAQVIDSLYTVRTEVTFQTDKDDRTVKQSLRGMAVALFGRYLLTLKHVVSIDRLAVETPLGPAVLPATKVAEHIFLEYHGEGYELECVLMDKGADLAVFRLPDGLSLRSFPYRIGNSDELQLGNFVYLVGNPMNFGINVREGIVSSLSAPAVVSKVNSVAKNAFMVSNGLNPGDSGAPVIAIRDGVYELVGISQGSFLASQRLGWVIRINNILPRIQSPQGSRPVVSACH
ncbi:MAG: trypsin-like peptidase domain-containing protein [Nitrospinota bacterium]